ncbi:hypothetical protein HanXRQr2_Chr13g0593141 [Helianthus annuus]|uniref:Uncharacterized protein n=1 Tax=Helianthus annuus TaxID=4232 RepID=A0A9K3EIS9_HELAN|nr:hypothetical protein HanXRQr2_Chr13g0593141 [Helianthus annuus]KAJ0849641.1 hypothetical protein HanPSC8_Chr13g0571181 [Helianthus annuus]
MHSMNPDNEYSPKEGSQTYGKFLMRHTRSISGFRHFQSLQNPVTPQLLQDDIFFKHSLKLFTIRSHAMDEMCL